MKLQTQEKREKRSKALIIYGVTLMAVMGVASITPAFPQIIAYFSIATSQVGWLIVAFTLPGIFLTPLVGVLADRYGRKPVLIPSLFLFGIAGLLCVFAKEYHTLLFFRFLQGVGASALSSLSVTLIGDLFDGPKRVQMMGYNASVLSIGTAAYPLIGGFMALGGWQLVFLFPLLAVPLGIYVLMNLQSPRPSAMKHLRAYFGNVWTSINKKDVWALFVVNILLFVILYGGFLTYLPVMVETIFQFGSAEIGLLMAMMSLVTAVSSYFLDRMSRLLSPKNLLMIASISYAISCVLLGMSNQLVLLFLGILLFGVGHGIMFPTIQTLLVGKVALEERAAFMSISSMVLRIGQTLGPLLVGLFFGLGGTAGAFGASAVVGLLMLLIVKLGLNEADPIN